MQQDQKWYRALYAFWQKNERVIWRGLEFVGLITAIIALVVGIFAWIETRKSNELAREAIDDSRIAQSWQIVTTRAPGSSGKKQALERLYASGEALQGVDLSCRTMGGWDDEKQKCVSRTNLQDLTLAKTEGGTRANLSDVNFSHAYMGGATLTGADMELANFTVAFMGDATLTGANMWAEKLDSRFHGSDGAFIVIVSPHHQFLLSLSVIPPTLSVILAFPLRHSRESGNPEKNRQSAPL